MYFAWTDAPGAKLRWSAVMRGTGRASVSFNYTSGDGDDKAVPYFRLFAVAKEATWRVFTRPPAPGNGSAPKPPVTNDAVGKLVKELDSSDTAVRDAAVKALTTITGQTFGADVKKWKEWWKEQKPETTTAAGTPVEVLQADATVRLHGVLAHTPKGIFLLGKETNGTETSTWELDVSKTPGLDKVAKDLSGKAVTATGTCPMVRVLSRPYGGAAEPATSTEGRWEMQRVVTVSQLAAEK